MPELPTAERIAAIALAILVKEGAAAVTMRRVAAEAGVTPMATYRHYPNREALLRKVAENGLDQVAGRWGRSPGKGFRAELDGLLDDFLDFALGQPHLYGFLLTDRRERARRFPDDFLTGGGSPVYNRVLAAVRRGIEEEELRADDPLEVALALSSAAQGLVQQYLGGRIALSEPEFRALCGRTVERILNGIKA
jgi:AcrR family transcriptional regulator